MYITNFHLSVFDATFVCCLRDDCPRTEILWFGIGHIAYDMWLYFIRINHCVLNKHNNTCFSHFNKKKIILIQGCNCKEN